MELHKNDAKSTLNTYRYHVPMRRRRKKYSQNANSSLIFLFLAAFGRKKNSGTFFSKCGSYGFWFLRFRPPKTVGTKNRRNLIKILKNRRNSSYGSYGSVGTYYTLISILRYRDESKRETSGVATTGFFVFIHIKEID